MADVVTSHLYGRGLSYPVRVDLDGRLATSAGELNVRESLCILLRTAPFERVERPDYGAGVGRHLYGPNDLASLRLIQEQVREAIATWEPRVALDDVRVAVNPDDPRAVDITVAYTLVATGTPGQVDTTVHAQSQG
ncbi:MAG TPA: GPW/gp25 family protein [Acidimicrobiales bacterium]|nr:GPW/gp25 family protein [Acidimicrobiales bacterium]